MSLRERFEAKFAKGSEGECWTWRGCKGPTGYGQIFVSMGKGPVSAHRVAWMLAHGEIPAGLHVLHRCDNPSCVNPAHLFLGTHDDNMADKVRKSRAHHPIGERNGRAKLTADHVRAIRRDPHRATELAPEYGVARSVISKIKSRYLWASVE